MSATSECSSRTCVIARTEPVPAMWQLSRTIDSFRSTWIHSSTIRIRFKVFESKWSEPWCSSLDSHGPSRLLQPSPSSWLTQPCLPPSRGTILDQMVSFLAFPALSSPRRPPSPPFDRLPPLPPLDPLFDPPLQPRTTRSTSSLLPLPALHHSLPFSGQCFPSVAMLATVVTVAREVWHASFFGLDVESFSSLLAITLVGWSSDLLPHLRQMVLEITPGGAHSACSSPSTLLGSLPTSHWACHPTHWAALPTPPASAPAHP